MRFGLLVAIVLAPLSCGGPAAETALAVRRVDTPTMLISGCRVRTETRCERLLKSAKGPVHVWLDVAANATVSVEFDGVALEASTSAVERGLAVDFELPRKPGVLRVLGRTPQWTEPVEVEIEWRAPPLLTLVARQARSRTTSRLAVASLQAALFFEARPRARLDILQAIRSTARRAGRGRFGLAAQARAREVAQELNAGFDFVELSLVLVSAQLKRGEVAAARRTLASLKKVRELPVELRAALTYYEGRVETNVGDYVAASRHFETVLRLSERVSDHRRYLAAFGQLAVTRSEAGDAAGAVQAATSGLQALRLIRDDCRLEALTRGELGWALLRVAEDASSLETARQAFLETRSRYLHECPGPDKVANQTVNLAWTALLDWEFDEAMRYIDELEDSSVPGHLQPWVHAVKSRVAYLTGGEHDDVSPLLDPVRVPRDPFLAWDADVLRGDRLRSLGLNAAATEFYAAAERRLAAYSEALGSATMQDSFLARRNESLVGLVESLIASGNVSEAGCRIRLALRRTVIKSDRAARLDALSPDRQRAWDAAMDRYLEARDKASSRAEEDWKSAAPEVARRRAARQEDLVLAEQALRDAQARLFGTAIEEACGDLPPRTTGTTTLIVLLGKESGIAILDADDGVFWAQKPVQEGREEAWAESVLGELPLDASSSVLRVIGTAAGRAIPWPRVPVGVGGSPLVEHLAVEWALDLPPRASSGTGRDVVVFGNPTGDLPAAKQEAELVAKALREGPWSVRLEQGAAATSASLKTAMLSASLLYFAGHGARSDAAERLGWEDALVLSDAAVAVPELLGLRRVPERIVLAGCDSGTTAASTLGGGLNLGRVLLLAGAREVVVASGKVDDSDTQILGAKLAQALSEDPTMRMSEALRAAQRHLRERRGASRWWQYRVLVP